MIFLNFSQLPESVFRLDPVCLLKSSFLMESELFSDAWQCNEK